jgi:hypothetical protein
MMALLDHASDGSVSEGAEASALQSLLKRKEFSAHEQAATFMLLVHGTDINAATQTVPRQLLRSATSMYEHIQLFIDRWHGVALNTLSTSAEVDRRVGLGQHALYQEPFFFGVCGILGSKHRRRSSGERQH